MPKVTIDLVNLDVIKDTLIILQDMFNDERLPEELLIEYCNRFDELWNKKNENGGNWYARRNNKNR